MNASVLRALTVAAVAFTALTCAAACGGDGARAPEAAVPGAVLQDAAPTIEPTPEGPKVPTVVLDPGHGGIEVGASDHGVVEKHSNLDMSLRIERLLQAAGVRVVLTRREDRRLAEQPAARSAFSATRYDLQARVDLANAEDADLFVSIHSNGSTDAGQNGVEVWFDPNRQFGAENRLLAETVLDRVLGELQAHGYAATDRGIKDDTCFRFRAGRCFPLFLLGVERTITRAELIRRGVDPDALGLPPGEEIITTRATAMPGVLVELLFISNPSDAAMLRDEGARDVMARGVATAVLQMLHLTPAEAVVE